MIVSSKMTYKKLFNMHFNNKTFTIFIDQYGRRTFLEVNKSGKHVYPLMNDFIILHKIYNERNIFICYNGRRLPVHGNRFENPTATFKEFTRNYIGVAAEFTAIILAATLITGVTTGRTLKLEKQDNQIKIVPTYMAGTLINNINELDEVLGYKSVSLEEVISAINTNDKISDYYKPYAINLAKFLKNKYPETDQRIYYENIKDMSIKICSEKQIEKYAAGTYNSALNITSLRDSYAEDKRTITHEFSHSYHHWKEETSLLPKYRSEQQGHSLDEAMNNKIISGIVIPKSYYQEGKTLDYFLTCVDYDYYDYEREGITKLIRLLKEKYTDIDIDYIINSLDSINVTNTQTDNYIRIEETPELLNQMFNLCAHNIDMNSKDIYQPFIDFMKLIDFNDYEEVADNYLKEYNKILLENGYDKEQVHEDNDDFAWMINEFELYKKSFREHVEDLDINEIPKDNIYEPLKNYLEYGGTPYRHYNSEAELHNLFYSLLDTYNDFLYCNGYTREQTITREMMQKKVDKYKGITITGYTITEDDVLHPMIDIPNIDKVYNTDEKIPILSSNGKIVLLDKDNVKTTDYAEDNVHQYNFIKSIFSRLDEDSIEFDESYWQDQFRIYNSEYKKIDFLLNGEKIAEDYLFDVNITVGQKQDGTNTFSLSSESQSIIQDKSTLKDQTIPFVQYLGDIPYKDENMTSIELGKYLSEDYLKPIVAGDELLRTNSSWLDIFTYDIENDVINVHPPYYVTIGEKQINMNKISLELSPEYAFITIDNRMENVTEEVNTDVKTESMIYLETVLEHYGILSEDKTDYHLSRDEILELYNNYSQDVYVNGNNPQNSIRENSSIINK